MGLDIYQTYRGWVKPAMTLCIANPFTRCASVPVHRGNAAFPVRLGYTHTFGRSQHSLLNNRVLSSRPSTQLQVKAHSMHEDKTYLITAYATRNLIQTIQQCHSKTFALMLLQNCNILNVTLGS